MLTAEATTTKQTLEDSHSIKSVKMERRDSTTSESSLEHLELGHTPKKFTSQSQSLTSTPHVTYAVNGHRNSNYQNNSKNTKLVEIPTYPANSVNLENKSSLSQFQQRIHDSDEANDYDEEESADEKQNLSRAQRHHKRRSSMRLDKRTNVQLEYNTDNPNSLRKKFRFSRSGSDLGTHPTNSLTNNESGFIDASSNSQYLNASAASVSTSQPQQQAISQSSIAPASHSSSSASSSPHGGEATSSISSPESGIGEREDMKYVCPICEFVSATPHDFTNHIRCHNYASGDTENFTCRICSKVLSSASSLDRHVLVHTGERPFNCKYCHLTFTTNGNMHRHMRTHKQHQHNHHHRRNSNGTKNNSNSFNHNNNNSSTTAIPSTQATPVNITNSSTTAQLPNGVGEGAEPATVTISSTPTTRTASASTKALPLHVTATNTTESTNISAGANRKRLVGSGVESYESDGGCSTDSSSAISQGVKMQKITNNNNTNKNNNESNSQNTIYGNDTNDIENKPKSSNVSSFKRKYSDHLDVNDTSLMKQRVKTTINNNIIGASNDNNPTAHIEVMSPAKSAFSELELSGIVCPICNATDFDNMLSLGSHMDSEHSDIAAKCRYCDVVFRTHRQLNVHPCTHKPNMSSVFKDIVCVDFSSDKFPLIAKSLSEQSVGANATSQGFECKKCFRVFPCTSALAIHAQECENTLNILKPSEDCTIFQASKQPNNSNSSTEAEEEFIDEEQQRNEFFRRLYLKNKSLHSQSMSSLPSSQHSNDEPLDEIKLELDGERNVLSAQSHDSKDLADIQSILNMTSSSSTSNFLRNFEQSVNTPSSNYSLDKDEEEAQDAFTSEFRKMKLRGEFPCKLCTAVFPNLRALKGHNRVHLSAVGANGPFRCNMCPYSICDKAALVRHMRTHNGDRPYECAVCNYAFTTKANCERHLRNRHEKTTRDEVKRAIIYHPSEDSTCDDSTKKLHMFSSPDFDDDPLYQHNHPKDRSTPVSHLKEMLTSENLSTKPMKIQVKSLEQLLDKSNTSSNCISKYDDRNELVESTLEIAPIDLSMDALDLSKKPSNTVPNSETSQTQAVTQVSTAKSVTGGDNVHNAKPFDDSKLNLPNLEKSQHLFLAQQQLMNESIPKIVDPAHYFQQLYRNIMFPAINPFLLRNSLMPNNLSDLQKLAPLMSRIFSVASLQTIDATEDDISANSASEMFPRVSPLIPEKCNIPIIASTPPSQVLSKNLAPATTLNNSLSAPRHQHMTPTVLPGGPVKMVIKNGVLMPKQKQRRYRTERPFSCDHCSARFTLRSNMERHVKQQHPQFYAQRQRSGHHIIRGRGASNSAAMNSIPHLQAAFVQSHNNGNSVSPTPISEQVKYAILAQQLKARKDTDLLQQALAHGSSGVVPNQMILNTLGGANTSTLSNGQQFSFNQLNTATIQSMEDDEPKLIIDEDKDNDVEEVLDEKENNLNASTTEEQLEQPKEKEILNTIESNDAAKKVAETILEQVIKAGKKSNVLTKPDVTAPAANTMNSMIAQAESVGKSLKEVASSSFKDESQDLVPVSKLVDNATSNSVSFNNYFRPSDVANNMEQSDEEGLVASGSASESNNSGTEDIAPSAEPKKKSAYSLAPNRVSCPYCQRMFPWSSSLRRHILTHTGQKPFKCSHCPLLFTTKSNCDRHLLRKHGNIESAVSVYVPTEDVSEPIPVPKSVEEIEQQQKKQRREEQERKRKAEEAQIERERLEKERLLHQHQEQQYEREQQLLKQLTATTQLNQFNVAPGTSPKHEGNLISSSELPFKCHLCENSFCDRFQCLEHIKIQHSQEFSLLLSKGAIDTDAEPNHTNNIEEEDRRPNEESNSSRGKYPDYSNRKVICAFCVRRFWSTEDLRRHMRTHSGERPFQCDICLRKFTLKHSMLRHMKKHNGRHHNNNNSGDMSAAGNSGSDFSDDEQSNAPTATSPPANLISNTLNLRVSKIQELLTKASEWRTSRLSSLGGEQKENIAEEHNHPTDLIGNLLGISDQGILNKLLSSADEAAKLLGVDK